MPKLSITYKILKKLGIHLSPVKYGEINPFELLGKAIRLWKNEILQMLAKSSVIIIPAPLAVRVLRPMLHRWRGVKVGRNVSIDQEVIFDSVYPEKIHLADGCIIANGVQIIVHKRDFSDYKEGDNVNDLGYIITDTYVGRGATIGIGAIILGGITIGDGAVVAAGALVTKDVEPYTLVAGVPAKLIRKF
ncbi:MAG: acetyltransferase [Candidatus Brocadia sp. WS118]|nr:MAG: acetyltransferase [Candidatus Brocadia sp. WS118]